MFKKNLLLGIPLFMSGMFFSQFSTGMVSLPTTSMSVKIDVDATNVTMTLTGSSTSWLGIGFSDEGMKSGADGFIYNSSADRDYTFNGVGVAPSADAVQNWTELSNIVASGIRTLVVRRTLAGGAGDYAFTNAAGSLPIFYGKGTSTALAYHGVGNKDFATLTFSPALAVDDVNSSAKKIGVYPNPVNDVLNFTNADKISSVKIYDSTGKQVVSQKSVVSLDVSQLMKGVYFIEFENIDGSKSYEKLIKN
ncbi:T9SS type A sorting domain-containing protein [Epilithonimonas zeae]|uniref:Por secretion system C-terminal sorting domain-containing protein n=1 Tax=Epilithonimonas zeae TaxID=1416779 RepID=A0A1N6J7F6_9FLAO|nr:T9SS type A sorting domain-containing protein [Epilithonimonas zeae]SIO40036.1 Por secretion system C-terminal sorting domain-containing protein [Epilithonimonas zeae]